MQSLLTGTDLLTIERTLQLAIAPAFLLSGVFALLTLLTNRLQRVADVFDEMREQGSLTAKERRHMARRSRLIYAAITCAIMATVLLCLLVIVGFLEPLAGVTAGIHIALLTVGAMLLTAAITFFLAEVLLTVKTLPTHKDK